MPIPAKPTITAPPAAPIRGEDQTSFANKANAYVAWIGTNVTDQKAVIDWQNTVFTATETEATNAASSATAAATSATEADNTLSQTIAVAATYTELHLGSHTTAPTTDNEGGPLVNGMLYYNPTNQKTFIWQE